MFFLRSFRWVVLSHVFIDNALANNVVWGYCLRIGMCCLRIEMCLRLGSENVLSSSHEKWSFDTQWNIAVPSRKMAGLAWDAWIYRLNLWQLYPCDARVLARVRPGCKKSMYVYMYICIYREESPLNEVGVRAFVRCECVCCMYLSFFHSTIMQGC